MAKVEVFYDPEQSHPYDLVGEVLWREYMGGIVNNYPYQGRRQMTFYTVTLYAGNDRTFVVYVRDKEMNIINLTGATLWFTVKEEKTGPVVFQKSTDVPGEGQIGSADEGQCYFYIVPSDTIALAIRQYVFDIKLKTESGKYYTILEGVINLNEPVNI